MDGVESCCLMEKEKYFSMDWKEGGTKMELWCNYTRCYLLCLDFSAEAKKIDLFLEGKWIVGGWATLVA